MIKFLKMFEKSTIFIVKTGLFLALFVTFYGLFSLIAPQLLRPSRTMFITLTTYLLAALLFLRIYGGVPIGAKKSKDIIASVALASFFTDLVAFVELVVMSEFQVIFDFYMLFIVFFIQLMLVIVGIYFGNWLFFKLHDPEKSILVYADEEAAREFLAKAGRYRKQWDVDFSLSYNTENLYKRLYPYKTVFLMGLPPGILSETVEFCYKYTKNVYVVPRLSDVIMKNSKTVVVDDKTVYASYVSSLSTEQRFVKRLLDLFISLVGVIVASPFMVICALAVKLCDRGPVFYKQKRITENGREFSVLKFRTMIVDAEKQSGSVWAAKDDDRITTVGRMLRKLRLDELPQLFNILHGEMSIVGPRPEREELIREFEKQYPEFRYRLKVKAGLTGMAQIMGKYNTTPLDKLMMDLEYIENYSIWLDLKLIFQTFKVFFKSDSTEGIAVPATEEESKEEP
ncbi:MAG: sugar transferase [Oscillospiraceae bacterium]|nr:sugar transferase [Oscillospiraceae bacterium]